MFRWVEWVVLVRFVRNKDENVGLQDDLNLVLRNLSVSIVFRVTHFSIFGLLLFAKTGLTIGFSSNKPKMLPNYLH